MLAKSILKTSVSDRFGLYKDNLLILLSHPFERHYRNVQRPYWDTEEDCRVKKKYTFKDHERSVYEAYFPTFPNNDWQMNYHRVYIAILPELDQKTFDEEVLKAKQTHLVSPVGKADSESIFIVAQKCKGAFVRGGKRQAQGFISFAIINRSPEIVFHRILSLLSNFILKRIKRLLEALNLDEYTQQLLRPDNNGNGHRLYYIHLINIIDSINHSLGKTFQYLCHSCNWFLKWVSSGVQEIIRQSRILTVLTNLNRNVDLLKKIYRGNLGLFNVSEEEEELIQVVGEIRRLKIPIGG